jgi:hypothetical protein
VKTRIAVIFVLVSFVFPTSVLAKKNREITLQLTSPDNCFAGEPCHVQAVSRDPEDPMVYNPPYTYAFRSQGNFYVTCLGWEVVKEGHRAVCISDDIGHGYYFFTNPGEYTVTVKVTDGINNKAFEKLLVQVLP